MSTIKPRTDTVVIYQGDDLAHLSSLDDKVTAAESALIRMERNNSKTVRLQHEADPVADAKAAIEAAKQERDEFAAGAEARGVKIVLEARARLAWRTLTREHPPRDGVEEDQIFVGGGGVNMLTFPEVLLPQSINREASTIEGDVVAFLESLNDYDYYDRVFMTALRLNRGSVIADPTQRLL
jgi:hypothetical protein